jgi:ABC-type lipoprotein export system ATPase subunit
VTHETFTAEHGKRIIRMKDGEIVSDEIITKRRFAADGELLK